ncbi:fumarylacetoacetate hydrolase family protein [Amnibacterium kyonggiense]|uniref:2-keto-4-pentenoate hydratase/2-oxohepta-3-ene-1,7-dioic acid hydratase in catechol pathway n=1 Tax=Amnibacterium kyonggiense TaxID=595671 RepID=A0A4V6Q0X9_9MICO|nr:fumarylacetoacetate hydrolase family protein [Amnibacterium kyonggiense]TDS75668.1 2-keto-4-pentenoate hydratase/2-oxohepta-3-ene-1,7-dioic acid hydratase in catechol pathway [Amnibacterium kyonggiense]
MTAFLRLGAPGAERPVLLADGRHYDLSSVTGDIDGAFLAGRGVDRARALLAEGRLEELPGAADLRVGPPVARPAAVLCIGQNYAAHAAESGSPPPTHPILFFKHPGSIVGPYDAIERPAGADALDWEVELGVVVGEAAWHVEEADALAHVAGYLVGNDVSERTWQRSESGGQWSKGKTAPTFCPLGPWLVPADEVDPTDLRIWSRISGEPRQDSSTGDLVFPVAALIADLSRYVRLEPGDVLLTGTPEGVALSGRFPYLVDGDVVEVGVDGLGAQRSLVVPV